MKIKKIDETLDVVSNVNVGAPQSDKHGQETDLGIHSDPGRNPGQPGRYRNTLYYFH